MNKFVAVYTACSLLVLLIAGQASPSAEEQLGEDDQQVDDMLESEVQLKKMINYVMPLMSIFNVKRKRSVNRRSTEGEEEEVYDYHADAYDGGELVETARARGGRRPPQPPPADRVGAYGRDGYGEYSSGSSYGGGGYGHSCCEKKDDLLPILALSALSLLLLYLIAIATTTTTRAGRKRRSDEDNDIIENEATEIGTVANWTGGSLTCCSCGLRS